MITPLRMKVKKNNYAHWKRHHHLHLIPVGMKLRKVSMTREKQKAVPHAEVRNHQMMLLFKSSPLMAMVMSPCFLKQWCDVSPDLHPKRQRKGARYNSETAARGVDEEHAKQKSVESKRFHYRNPPMWTTPMGLILTGWRMRCPVCYHQDRHSATCSERCELPVILWIQPMFIHSIVHYMTYADGEWWHDHDPKP